MEVHAWMVKMMTGEDDFQHSSAKEVVFLTEGINLAQLQEEIESRFVAEQRTDILEIHALGPIGNRKQ
jgi:hypothetical protein